MNFQSHWYLYFRWIFHIYSLATNIDTYFCCLHFSVCMPSHHWNECLFSKYTEENEKLEYGRNGKANLLINTECPYSIIISAFRSLLDLRIILSRKRKNINEVQQSGKWEIQIMFGIFYGIGSTKQICSRRKRAQFQSQLGRTILNWIWILDVCYYTVQLSLLFTSSGLTVEL